MHVTILGIKKTSYKGKDGSDKVQVGDVVNLIYEPGFEGKATLVDMQMVKISTTPFDKKGDK